jgi:hypothetical protein
MQFIEGQSLAEVIAGLRQLPRPGKASVASTGGRARPGTLGGAATDPSATNGNAAAAATASEQIGALATAYSKNTAQFHRAVAWLGIQAAEALEHAHACGVVHRDVKPANLLVDAHGHLWVTDFGLAQFQTDAGLTQTGDLLGTLRYMSPEQAGGQRGLIDHRTDVYSLGATLYELLTLRPPFDGADRQTLLRQILHDEPPPPRALEKAIPAELETIVLKALAKTPAERYATAQDLADDLGRFLAHQPIRARRATALQRLLKWARRHPSVVVAGFALCVGTAAVSLTSAALLRQRYQEAEERFLLARESVDEIVRVCQEELADKPYLDNVRRRLLEDALVYYQKLIEQRRDHTTREQLAENRKQVQQILDDLAALQGAGQLHLLREPAVLDDLGLAGEQRDRVVALSSALHNRTMDVFREFRQLTPEQRRQRFVDLARASEADAEAILTATQLARLRQIDLQVQGPRAFEDPKVTATLGLTAAQRQRVRAILAEGPFGGLFGPDAARGKGREARDKGPSHVERIKDVLTEEQKGRWRELTGEPYKGPPRMRLVHPPPDGPRPGR